MRRALACVAIVVGLAESAFADYGMTWADFNDHYVWLGATACCPNDRVYVSDISGNKISILYGRYNGSNPDGPHWASKGTFTGTLAQMLADVTDPETTMGNLKDVDSDGDGASDLWELGNGTDPGDDGEQPATSEPDYEDMEIDTDGDGCPDGVELLAGTNPFDASDKPTWEEIFNGADSDGDGVSDAYEIWVGTNPYDAGHYPVWPSSWDMSTDTDGDGYPDDWESFYGFDPNDSSSHPTGSVGYGTGGPPGSGTGGPVSPVGTGSGNPYGSSTDDPDADDPTEDEDVQVTDDPNTWIDEGVVGEAYEDFREIALEKLGVAGFAFFWNRTGADLPSIELELPEVLGVSMGTWTVDLVDVASAWWVGVARGCLLVVAAVGALRFAVGRL